ncbi:glycoside hydrolase family 5 protein [Sphaerobolus stellatus SS14]|nr:glycoside hydrolase family 5 protein [Sphaerobolus stellatus SS14]
MFSKYYLAVLSAASCALAKILYAGVNEVGISGGEFGVFGTKGTGLPGRFGVDYAFINESAIDIFVDQEKVNFFRVTFLMERMAPVATGLAGPFNETYFGFYQDAINYITVTKGVYALLDPHNYMRYNDPSSQPNSGSIIGDTTDPNAASTDDFQAFWQELASRFVDNEKVVFGIMNEPHDLDTALLLANDQAAINGIRAAGAKQLILAPGNGFTGGHSWNQTTGADFAPSSQFLGQITDSLNNTAIDVHERYLDADFSGTHNVCTQPGPSNLEGLLSFLQETGFKAVLSEFGAGNNANCFQFVDDLLTFLEQNDEFIGWTAWAAGPFWGTADACCGPDTGSLEPNTLTTSGTPGAFSTVWANAIRPHVPTGTGTLKTSGVSSLS